MGMACRMVDNGIIMPISSGNGKIKSGRVYDMEYAGRNRRYYKLTEKGEAQLRLYKVEWKNYTSKINTLFEGGR